MNCRLTIGIFEASPGWRILLGQCGTSFEEIVDPRALRPDRYSVVVLNRSVGTAAIAALEEYMRAGGSVLDTVGLFARLDGRGVRVWRTRYLIPDDDDQLLRDLWNIDLFVRTRRYDGATHLAGTLDIAPRGAGWLASLGLPVDRLLTDSRRARKLFYAPSGTFPSEVVSLVSKGEVRRLVEIVLRRLHRLRGVPYVHAWYFPGDRRNVFCYRIDSDYGSREEIVRLYDIARRRKIPMTWFLHVQAHEEWLSLFRTFVGQEIAVHCYRHRTYSTYQENGSNIAEALWLLRRAGFDPHGFAAPNGVWNAGLGRAIRDHGFLYSSEFSLGYDDLPFFPPLSGGLSPVVQVPVHPVSVGNFLRVRGSSRDMIGYYASVIRRKLLRQDPLIFYHHPTHRADDVVESIADQVADAGVEAMSFADYAAWWIERARFQFSAEYDRGRLRVSGTFPEHPVFLRVEHGENRGFIDAAGEISLESIPHGYVEAGGIDRPDDLRRERSFSLKALFHTIEDINTRMRQ